MQISFSSCGRFDLRVTFKPEVLMAALTSIKLLRIPLPETPEEVCAFLFLPLQDAPQLLKMSIRCM